MAITRNVLPGFDFVLSFFMFLSFQVVLRPKGSVVDSIRLSSSNELDFPSHPARPLSQLFAAFTLLSGVWGKKRQRVYLTTVSASSPARVFTFLDSVPDNGD